MPTGNNKTRQRPNQAVTPSAQRQFPRGAFGLPTNVWGGGGFNDAGGQFAEAFISAGERKTQRAKEHQEQLAREKKQFDETFSKLIVPDSGVSGLDMSMSNIFKSNASEIVGINSDLKSGKLSPAEASFKETKLLGDVVNYKATQNVLKGLNADTKKMLEEGGVSDSTPLHIRDARESLLNSPENFTYEKGDDGVTYLVGKTNGDKDLKVSIGDIASGKWLPRYNATFDDETFVDQSVEALNDDFTRRYQNDTGQVWKGNIPWNSKVEKTANSLINKLLSSESSKRDLASREFITDPEGNQVFKQLLTDAEVAEIEGDKGFPGWGYIDAEEYDADPEAGEAQAKSYLTQKMRSRYEGLPDDLTTRAHKETGTGGNTLPPVQTRNTPTKEEYSSNAGTPSWYVGKKFDGFPISSATKVSGKKFASDELKKQQLNFVYQNMMDPREKNKYKDKNQQLDTRKLLKDYPAIAEKYREDAFDTGFLGFGAGSKENKEVYRQYQDLKAPEATDAIKIKYKTGTSKGKPVYKTETITQGDSTFGRIRLASSVKERQAPKTASASGVVYTDAQSTYLSDRGVGSPKDLPVQDKIAFYKLK